ncbi:MAG: hypothetical protein OHK005_02560 [Candidatus Methylacidiphilales bacterium]
MEGFETKPPASADFAEANGIARTHRRQRESKRGQTLTEYSLILLLIVLAVVAVLTALSDVVKDTLWTNTLSNTLGDN